HVAAARLPIFRRQRRVGQRIARRNRDELPSIGFIADRVARCAAVEDLFPEHLAGFRMEGTEATVIVSYKDQVAAGRKSRTREASTLIELPHRLARRSIDGCEAANISICRFCNQRNGTSRAMVCADG